MMHVRFILVFSMFSVLLQRGQIRGKRWKGEGGRVKKKLSRLAIARHDPLSYWRLNVNPEPHNCH